MGAWNDAKRIDILVLRSYLRREIEYDDLQQETRIFSFGAMCTDPLVHTDPIAGQR